VEFEKAAISVASGPLGSPYEFTSYSFARDKSNISADDLRLISKNFGITNPWNSIRAVSAKAGLAITGNIDEVFRLLARERHKAAHVAAHNVPYARILSALPEATSIALGFDVLLSTATQRLNTSGSASGSPQPATSDTDIEFIEVKPHKGKWAAFSPTASRAMFVAADQVSAMSRAHTKAMPLGYSVVCQDASGRPSNWTTQIG